VAAGLAVALPVALPASEARASPHDLEIAVEATYFAIIPHFVTWPAAALPSPSAPFVLCIQGADPFGPILDRLVADRLVGGRPIQVRRLARLDPTSGCQVAYLGGGTAQSQAQAVEALGGAPVITVTDETHGGGRGIIHFVRDGPRLRFAVDEAQAEQRGMAVSSKVLALAVAVKR
jgi:hypothetical protein